MREKLFILLQTILPQHLLSRCAGILANCQWKPLKNLMIRWFIQHYHVDMSIAEKQNSHDYLTFNDFFTRKLKPGIRRIHTDHVISPADGMISQMGKIQKNKILQAKNHEYSLETLLTNAAWTSQFLDGEFMTIYLSPKDYHRVHIPTDGKLLETIYVPGKLFSVNETTANHIENLFANNERLICRFQSEKLGSFAVILVGAMIVAAIRTVWSGLNFSKTIQSISYENKDLQFKTGDEIGNFELGSTAILLFEKGKIEWNSALKSNIPISYGDVVDSI